MIIITNVNSPSSKVPKGWGEEIILHNGEYCGKLLRFKEGTKFSMHFHKEKNETWYINKGKFILTWIDTRNAERYIIELNEGDIVDVEQLTPHQLEALVESEIFEISTAHHNYDNYRVEKGNSQK
jgi:mannose-6-phosphate isomerase-like protein (cupin superfamily)